MPAQQLTELETNLATLLIGVDTLFSGDVLHPSGTKHFIADTWISGMKPPEIYDDEYSKAFRESGGVRYWRNATKVTQFVKKYHLPELPEVLRKELAALPDKDQKAYLAHTVNALEVMLRTAVAIANRKAIPSYEERYRAATIEEKDDEHFQSLLGTDEIKPINPKESREALRQALSKAGQEVKRSRNLRETMLAWQNTQEYIPKEKVKEVAGETIRHLHKLTRRNIFSHLNPGLEGHESDLIDIAFDGYRFETVENKFFTGSLIYRGGQKSSGQNNVQPALEALYEYNTDHPVTRLSLLKLCSHEMMPGHYFNMAMIDLLWRDGRLPFAATMGTMCTPSSVFQEGWAQNALELIYGSRENAIRDFGHDLGVEFALDDLQDIGKHNASILHQLQGKSIDAVRKHLAEQCVLPDPLVKKLSGAWAQDLIIGPMYGPAYYLGQRVVNHAIDLIGPAKVARIGLHLDGLVDIGLFQEKVWDEYERKIQEQLQARG